MSTKLSLSLLTAILSVVSLPVNSEQAKNDPLDPYTLSVPVKPGIGAETVVESLKSAAAARGLLFVGESPFYKQVEAITGERYRYVNILSFNDTLLAKSLLDYSDRYAPILPLRIAVVEDMKGKLWLHSMNFEAILRHGQGASTKAADTAAALQDSVGSLMKAAAVGEL